MRYAALIATLILSSLPACQRTSGDAVPAAYRADVENICEAEGRSGALAPDQDPNRRSIVVAQWLGSAVKTDEGRSFLASLAKLAPAQKGDALRREATRVGLTRCAVAETWK